MKKIFLAAIMMVAVNAVYGQKVTDPKERKELKDVFYSECMSGADESDKETYAVMKKYCDCSGEKMLDNFSKKELEAFNDMNEEELANKLMPVIQGCLQRMQKDLEAIENKKK